MIGSTLLLAAGLSTASAETRTLRLDYVHVGNAGEERFALDGLALEGPWPGPADRRLDETNLGKYFFEVSLLRNHQTVYSRGFASVYGEWETTAEAKDVSRAFHESLRFPEPPGPA